MILKRLIFKIVIL